MFILIQFIFISHRHPHTFTTCTLCKPLPLMKGAVSCQNVWYFKENLWLVISAREPWMMQPSRTSFFNSIWLVT